MANIVKYAPVKRTNGERIATNGYYTGYKKGTPMQAKNEVVGAYDVEDNTIRYGTMMGDAAQGSMPSIGVGLKQILTGCTASITDNIVSKDAALEITYTVASGYTMPSSITVKIGGATKTANTDYTWASNKLTIAKAKITGDIEVTVTATNS